MFNGKVGLSFLGETEWRKIMTAGKIALCSKMLVKLISNLELIFSHLDLNFVFLTLFLFIGDDNKSRTTSKTVSERFKASILQNVSRI